MQRIYLGLCLLGFMLPLATFAPWLGVHGIDLPLLLHDAIATPVSAFAWSDVLVSALALIVFVIAESLRLGCATVGLRCSAYWSAYRWRCHCSCCCGSGIWMQPGACRWRDRWSCARMRMAHAANSCMIASRASPTFRLHPQ